VATRAAWEFFASIPLLKIDTRVPGSYFFLNRNVKYKSFPQKNQENKSGSFLPLPALKPN
jgi:hypothetical protein